MCCYHIRILRCIEIRCQDSESDMKSHLAGTKDAKMSECHSEGFALVAFWLNPCGAAFRQNLRTTCSARVLYLSRPDSCAQIVMNSQKHNTDSNTDSCIQQLLLVLLGWPRTRYFPWPGDTYFAACWLHLLNPNNFDLLKSSNGSPRLICCACL